METLAVELQSVSRRFGDVRALEGVSLGVRPGEFFSLLGSSGCGKTTLLRIIAGLEWPDRGSVFIAGAAMAETPAHKRPVNTVFQSYALFPHLSVRKNIAFGLRMKNVPGKELCDRVDRVLDMVQISELADRKPSQLSGGQKQRVALARAVVNEPRVLLLDEPLGALDLKLRKQLRTELRELQRRLGITFIHVTHDQEEALVMSDRIALMESGRLIQTGLPEHLYNRPRTRFAAQFLGSCNLLDGTVAATGENRLRVRTALGEVHVRVENLPNRPEGEKLTLAIRPERVELLARNASSHENAFLARIGNRAFAGSEAMLELNTSAGRLFVSVPNSHPDYSILVVGSEVVASLPAERLLVLDD